MLVSKLFFFLDFGFLVEGPKVFRVLIFFACYIDDGANEIGGSINEEP